MVFLMGTINSILMGVYVVVLIRLVCVLQGH